MKNHRYRRDYRGLNHASPANSGPGVSKIGYYPNWAMVSPRSDGWSRHILPSRPMVSSLQSMVNNKFWTRPSGPKILRNVSLRIVGSAPTLNVGSAVEISAISDVGARRKILNWIMKKTERSIGVAIRQLILLLSLLDVWRIFLETVYMVVIQLLDSLCSLCFSSFW